MKALSVILILLGVVALAIAGTLGGRDIGAIRDLDGRLERADAERDSLIAEIGDTNLRYRAFQKSIPTLPDSTKQKESGRISVRLREFNKSIRLMEVRERDLKLDMNRYRRDRAERVAHLRKWAGTAAASGLVLVVAGGVLLGRSRRSFGA